jgi:hypothetical protein
MQAEKALLPAVHQLHSPFGKLGSFQIRHAIARGLTAANAGHSCIAQDGGSPVEAS